MPRYIYKIYHDILTKFIEIDQDILTNLIEIYQDILLDKIY